MWDDRQLDLAKYVTYIEQDSNQDINAGTIEIEGANTGIYLMTPVPPYGGLGTASNQIDGMKFGATVPNRNLSRAFVPRGRPVPERTYLDQYVIHDFGKPNL